METTESYLNTLYQEGVQLVNNSWKNLGQATDHLACGLVDMMIDTDDLKFQAELQETLFEICPTASRKCYLIYKN